MLQIRTTLVLLCFLVTGLALSAAPTDAQLRRPRAELTPVVLQQAIQSGQAVSGELRVELPDDIHVQSDEPRDPYLIPTRLRFTLPEGVTVEEMTYPPSTDWLLEGSDEPLAVFEHEFAVEWRLALAADVSPGEMIIPGSFTYQACDDRICFPPVTAAVEWRVTVD
ncbi:MAG: protein-disulfide reductase DsbD family protein [Gemmatimonadota bacterium]|nr:protein-disulfide reductase DsbD family protein [Gemmatimonadota bacterium]